MAKRQLSKGKGGYKPNTLQNVSRTTAEFIKCPVNIGDNLKPSGSNLKPWKNFRLYVRYLDLKAQNPDCGTFEIFTASRHYQRVIKALLQKGWAERSGRKQVKLRAYQHVWRQMGIPRIAVIDHRTKAVHRKWKYWKFPIEQFSQERKTYLKEIETAIREKITERKLAQIRRALRDKGDPGAIQDRATFSAMSAGSLFGYRSPSTGSKLRNTFFEIVEQTPEQAKPKFRKERGRFEDDPKEIFLRPPNRRSIPHPTY